MNGAGAPRSRSIALAVLIATCLIAATLPAGAQGSFYREARKDDRIYVFNIMKVWEQWEATGEMGKSITRVGAGPCVTAVTRAFFPFGVIAQWGPSFKTFFSFSNAFNRTTSSGRIALNCARQR